MTGHSLWVLWPYAAAAGLVLILTTRVLTAQHPARTLTSLLRITFAPPYGALPWQLGILCVAADQAAGLSLHDGERLKGPPRQRETAAWADVDDRVRQHLQAADARGARHGARHRHDRQSDHAAARGRVPMAFDVREEG